MAFATGRSTQREFAAMNITPMIDILLVLLIIFIIPHRKTLGTFDIQLPIDPAGDGIPVCGPIPNPDMPGSITMKIVRRGVTVNTRSVPSASLAAFLRNKYRDRPNKVIFVKAAPDVPYGDVIGYIDTARSAGVTIVFAVLPEGVTPQAP
jgi:biopolymer transport protein ExbD